MRVLVIVLLVIAAMACSDRVPAPVTPTPSPRPGYPPAPVTALPEGVLFVQQPSSVGPLLFGIDSNGVAGPYVRTPSVSVSPDRSRAAAWTQEANLPSGIGILTGTSYEELAKGPWTTGSPMSLWSNDGKHLAYTIPDDSAGGKVHIWTLDIDTGEEVRLTSAPDFYSPTGWTAKGELLVSGPQGLVLFGAGSRGIPLPESGQVMDLAVSPDGTRAAALMGENVQVEDYYETRYSGLWLLDSETLRWKQLVDMTGTARAGGGGRYVSAAIPSRPHLASPALLKGLGPMSWSPDNRRISFYSPQGPGGPLYQFGLNVVDVLTGDEWHLHDQANWQDAWSQDGRYLAYVFETTNEAGQSERHLGILGPDGRTSDAALPTRGMAWTKDSRLLLDIPGRLGMLDPETMEVKDVLTQDGKTISVFIEQGVWSPSGRYLAAPTPGDMYRRPSLFVVDTEEGKARALFEGSDFTAAAWLRE